MQEVSVSGKIYIAAKKAAELCGYAQDYVGQLSRKGAIDAQRVGGHWYVSLESLTKYKKRSDETKPEPPKYNPEPTPDTVTSLTGKNYISASRASEITGYNSDYVGQLARAGKIKSEQIGNRWYVDEDSLSEHKKEKDGLLAAVQTDSVGLQRSQPGSNIAKGNLNKPLLEYFSDTRDLIPYLREKRVEEQVIQVNKIEEKVPELTTEEVRIPIRKMPTPRRTETRPEIRKIVSKKAIVIPEISNISLSFARYASIFLIILVGAFFAYNLLSDTKIFSKNLIPNIETSAISVEWAEPFTSQLEKMMVPEIRYRRE